MRVQPLMGRVFSAEDHAGFWHKVLNREHLAEAHAFFDAGAAKTPGAATILGRLEEHFGGRVPSPAELLAADPQVELKTNAGTVVIEHIGISMPR